MTVTQATIRELWSYPVKGCQGVPRSEIEVTPMGVRGDRGFAVWRDGKLVDQKETPLIASIEASLEDDGRVLKLSHAEHGDFVHRVRDTGRAQPSQWVLDKFETIDQGDEVAAWISSILGKEVRLVRPGDVWKINFPIPQMKLIHDQPKQRFFAASPVSLANQASLDDLNARLEQPVPMNRFRVNVIVDGLEAFAEDDVVSLESENASLLQVTPAERCVIITTDQGNGTRPKSDLLKVLSDYRRKPEAERFGSGLIFGSYMTVGKAGVLSVGDRLRVR
jgi:uncharacterized protein YcbX